MNPIHTRYLYHLSSVPETMFFLLKLEWNLIFGIKTKTHIHEAVLLTDSTLEKQELSLTDILPYFFFSFCVNWGRLLWRLYEIKRSTLRLWFSTDYEYSGSCLDICSSDCILKDAAIHVLPLSNVQRHIKRSQEKSGKTWNWLIRASFALKLLFVKNCSYLSA